MGKNLPQPPTRAPFGHLPFAFDLLDLLNLSRKNLGDAFAWQMGPKYIAVFSSKEANEAILLDRENALSAIDSFGPQSWMLGQGLARLDGLQHRSLKKLLLPAFHRELISRHQYGIETRCLRYLKQWSQQGWINGVEASKSLTLGIITEFLFGTEAKALEPLQKDLRLLFRSLMVEAKRPASFFGFWQMLKLPGIPNLRARLDKKLLNLIATATSENSLISLLKTTLTEEGTALTQDMIRDQLLTFIVAGHDTTATALAWLFFELARQPDYLEALKSELYEVPLEAANLAQLPLFNAVIKETLRLHPPISIGIRRSLREQIIDGYIVPKGANVIYSPYLSHRDPRYWSDAELFKPERFLTNQASRFSYLPFGGGQHSCIGMNLALFELQLILATFIRNGKWQIEAPVQEHLAPTLEPSGLSLRFQSS
ncbi:MAG: cytochrome P450 [Trueperaceae bacterium]|nr:cytochrome P450 [Trueperaceae bacterium]